jgi:hypothetical protein
MHSFLPVLRRVVTTEVSGPNNRGVVGCRVLTTAKQNTGTGELRLLLPKLRV